MPPRKKPVPKRRPGRPPKPEKMRRLVLYLPEGLEMDFRHRAVTERKTLSILGTEAIERLLDGRAESDRKRNRRGLR